MSGNQEHHFLALLWDALVRDLEHPDRVQTGWGTKTKEGLIKSINRIMENRV